MVTFGEPLSHVTTQRGPFMTSRKLATRGEPNIRLRCSRDVKHSLVLPMKNTRLTTTPSLLPLPPLPSLSRVCPLKTHSVCTFKTYPCVPAPRAHVETRVRVVPVHTGTFLDGHTGLFSVSHTIHHTAHTPHNTQDTRHKTQTKQQHNNNVTRRQRQRETERDRERRQGQRERREDGRGETKQEKRRQKKTRDELAQNVLKKKKPFGRIIPPFFLRKFRTLPLFQLFT